MMIYKAMISVKNRAEQPNLISKVFEAEDKKIKNRASYTIKRTKTTTTFSINADGIAGLRATLNSITKVLAVTEKVGNVN